MYTKKIEKKPEVSSVHKSSVENSMISSGQTTSHSPKTPLSFANS